MIVSQTICLYGADHLPYALRAVEPLVDKVFVFYTSQPSHGTSTNIPCPDSRDDIMRAIDSVKSTKIVVIEGIYSNESEHRAEIFKYVSDDDLIVVCDADEVWNQDKLEKGIKAAYDHNCERYKVRMTHLWRSFSWTCTDPMTQDRLIRRAGAGILYSPFSSLPDEPDIWHLGYARAEKDIAYKIGIHGHRAEWRDEWLNEKFLNWSPGVIDVHPTCKEDFWIPQPFDKTKLPIDLYSHPYYNLEIIQ